MAHEDMMQKKIDEVEEWADGHNFTERWNVSSRRSNKRDDKRHRIIK